MGPQIIQVMNDSWNKAWAVSLGTLAQATWKGHGFQWMIPILKYISIVEP